MSCVVFSVQCVECRALGCMMFEAMPALLPYTIPNFDSLTISGQCAVCSVCRGTSLIRNTHLPRTSVGP
jgi:hypothetical protein